MKKGIELDTNANKSLIIVESPAKAATIKKYLDNGFNVEASAGHIKDLPERTLGVDIKRGFRPRFELLRSKKKLVEHLRKIASCADRVYIATDPDREGEAIAFHLAEEIGKDRVLRVLFHEITRDAVRRALREPRELDEKMYESQLTRRILDRLVGYQISPLLWRKVQGGLSAGRVQSVAVRLVVEREREIEAFVPAEYWVINATLDREQPTGHTFVATLKRINGQKASVGTSEEADSIVTRLKRSSMRVLRVEIKEKRRPPSPPFITSTLQQEAFRLFRFSPAHTMAIAQRLYEGCDLGEEGRVGLITYMRTDSVRIASEAIEGARRVIEERFGSKYLPDTPVFYRNKRAAQDAHEAIRPTMVQRTPADVQPYLDKDEYRLYSLIWSRFLSCQMVPAIYEQTVVDVAAACDGEDFAELTATGSLLKFDGYLAVSRGEREEEREAPPSDLKEGEALTLVSVQAEQKFTEPPPRFSEATLVRELEERGIGRPSTYATIVSTIQSKGYVKRVEGKLRPTEMGRLVNDLLVAHFPDVVDYEFTARMEEDLDEIEEGRKRRIEVLNNFYEGFEKTLKKAASEMRSIKAQALPAGVTCERCGKPMLIRFGKNGPFLGCSGFPDCRNTTEFERDENGHVAARDQKHVGTCPLCSRPLVVKMGRFGKFVACSNYPECKYTQTYTRSEHCPIEGCDGLLTERRSRKGKPFYACSNYPKCNFVTSREPVSQTCQKCGAPTMFSRGKKGLPVCLRPGCAPARKRISKKVAG